MFESKTRRRVAELELERGVMVGLHQSELQTPTKCIQPPDGKPTATYRQIHSMHGSLSQLGPLILIILQVQSHNQKTARKPQRSI